jgi:hypothetical protein
MRGLCFEPVSCAMALSVLEHALQGPRRACPRAKLWLRRAPVDYLLDATLGEASDPLIDALNLLDSHAVPGMGLVILALVLVALGHRLARPPAGKPRDVALGVVVER